MAKKFQFRLDVVRGMRRRARDEAARVVSEKIGQVVAVQQRVETLSGQLRETVALGRSDRDGHRIEIAALKAQQYYSTWLHGRITENSMALERVEAQLAVERAKLTQATANFKAIEKLRDRRWQTYQFGIRKEEQAITDEIAGRMMRRSGTLEADETA